MFGQFIHILPFNFPNLISISNYKGMRGTTVDGGDGEEEEAIRGREEKKRKMREICV